MDRTSKNLDMITYILNNNPICQEQMQKLVAKANEIGMTESQFNQVKQQILFNLFVDICGKIPEIKNDLAMDIWENKEE